MELKILISLIEHHTATYGHLWSGMPDKQKIYFIPELTDTYGLSGNKVRFFGSQIWYEPGNVFWVADYTLRVPYVELDCRYVERLIVELAHWKTKRYLYTFTFGVKCHLHWWKVQVQVDLKTWYSQDLSRTLTYGRANRPRSICIDIYSILCPFLRCRLCQASHRELGSWITTDKWHPYVLYMRLGKT